jgi:[acyl-carrier-protein] S-malonyltransferase
MREVWIFPGQGSQYPGMGWPLYEVSGNALSILHKASLLAALPLDQIMKQGSREQLAQPVVLEPAMVALQIAYVEELRRAGRHPDFVAGYSLGELAAFYCAEVLSLDDALRIAVLRSRILQKLAGESWRMATVRGLPLQTVEEIVARIGSIYSVAVAAHNAPGHSAITGERHGVLKAEIKAFARGGLTAAVEVAGPWHCSIAAGCAAEVRAALEQFDFKPPRLPLYSSATGGPVSSAGELRRCLAEQICVPVLWNEVVNELWRQGARKSLEIGPGHVLTGFVRRTWPQGQYQARFLERANGGAVLPPEIFPVRAPRAHLHPPVSLSA